MFQGVCFQDVFINPIPFLIGSVFPDSDHPKAPMGRILPLHWFFNHRGFTHTLGGMVVFSLPIGIFYKLGMGWPVCTWVLTTFSYG
jgi:membrane-bound metal-dependent hydrolase YbcI (DUF457 family)